MNYYKFNQNLNNSVCNCNTNVIQALSEKRDAMIVFRLPKWRKEEIRKTGKSEADFIIELLAKSMPKPIIFNDKDWLEEVNQW